MLKTNHGRFAAILVSLLALTAVADEAVDPADADDEAAKKYDEIVVTGTRLLKGDPTARVDVITSEDIEARGLSTAEQVIRSIPQNLSTINITSNSSLKVADGGGDSHQNGLSTANLRGFGSANTLVLLNGKRTSGSYGNHDAVVNLRDIPAAAIERVEVHLDGGSSVYGADGVAGVINIITKKGFKGGHVDVRAETSSTGADSMRYSGYFGTSWDGGSVSLNASHTDSKPYSSYKAGFTTKDYSGMFGGNPIYNFNIRGRVVDDEYVFSGASYYRSATVKTSRFSQDWLILPAGDDGRNAQPGDFQPVSAADAIEVLDQDAGGSTLDTSYLLDIEHTFADKVRVRGSYSYTEAETKTRETPPPFGLNPPVPASNAFNNFTAPDPVSGEPVPIDVFVQYYPVTEVELGLIPPRTDRKSVV